MNKQRETIYGLRRRLMEEPDQRDYLVGETGVARDLLEDITKKYLNPDVPPDLWDVDNYKLQIHTIYALDADAEGIDFRESTEAEVEEAVWAKVIKHYEEKEQQVGVEAMRTYERIIMLNIIDAQWKDHLLSLDHVKQGIGLVGYGQKDPLVEYKKQSFDMFQEMLDRIDTTTIRSLFNLQVVAEQPPEALRQRRLPRRPSSLTFTGPNQGAAAAGEEAGKVKPIVRDQPKVGRNEARPWRLRQEIQEVLRRRRPSTSNWWRTLRVPGSITIASGARIHIQSLMIFLAMDKTKRISEVETNNLIKLIGRLESEFHIE
jgi:preprotein translocase subunit SecA